MTDIKKIVSELTVEQKAVLFTGRNNWHFRGLKDYGIEEIMVSDGPHGLRKQEDDTDAKPAGSLPATCFPTASALASSWNKDLLRRIGEALGTECRAEDVAVLLGPGVNIKRSPLCGRNFEYFSEDPLLSGELAASFINGVQGMGTGCSLKHFTANNQETLRMTIDALIDERSLRELYLPAFEIAVKKSSPWTIMCSYNRINGIYVSEHRRLLTEILRDEWGWGGVMITDWGACNERVAGLAAGQDIEMPDSGDENSQAVTEAVKSGRLPEAVLDTAAERIISLLVKAADSTPAPKFSYEDHHALAKKAAAESIVLLRNENDVLPLRPDDKIAVIGEFAVKPRYQGAGSSRVNPSRVDNFLDEIKKYYPDVLYSAGYRLGDKQADQSLINEAVAAAEDAGRIILMTGLPDEYESEGFDRTDLSLPETHRRLIDAMIETGKEIIVCLSNGAPVEMPWNDSVAAVLECYLGGQAGAGALADILTGKICPSGRLAETFALSLEDTPAREWFPGGPRQTEYREGLYVGYRYYQSCGVPVLYPFGHGLSYTSFAYSELTLSTGTVNAANPEPEAGIAELTFTLKNTGSTGGAEVCQLYISGPGRLVHRPALELRDFTKVNLPPGESTEVSFSLNKRALAHWDISGNGWAVEPGVYRLIIGSSAADIRLESRLEVLSDWTPATRQAVSAYSRLRTEKDLIHRIPGSAFSAEYGKAIPPNVKSAGFNRTTSLSDFASCFTGRQLLKFALKNAQIESGGNENSEAMYEATAREMPLRSVAALSGKKFTMRMVDAMIEMGSGHFIRGSFKLLIAALRRK